MAVTTTKRFGPAFLVTAAFIGPGTITTATQAGARFGLTLLWVLAFSVLATIVLQEMAARLGLVTRRGLGEALRESFTHPVLRAVIVALVVAAIAFGNAAFQAGNLTGAAIGLEVLGGPSRRVWVILVSVAAGGLLLSGTYRRLERLLIVLVGVMSAVFLVTAVMVRPSWTALTKGLFHPSLPDGAITMTVALVGTTVVPYNLFLHASAVTRKWSNPDDVPRSLRAARLDTILAVGLGGAITLAVMTTASAFFIRGAAIDTAAAMAGQLEPLLGRSAKVLFALGLAAAGITSALTAPMAAAFATCGALGWRTDLASPRFRMVWLLVLAIGATAAIVWERSPIETIVFAQAANGLILPIVAVFLLVVVNRTALMRRFVNGAVANVLGAAVVLLAGGLGYRKIAWAIHELLSG